MGDVGVMWVCGCDHVFVCVHLMYYNIWCTTHSIFNGFHCCSHPLPHTHPSSQSPHPPLHANTVGLLVLPESPRWLVVQGRLDEALAVMHRVYTKERLPIGVQQSTAEVEHELLLLWSGVQQEAAAAADRRRRRASVGGEASGGGVGGDGGVGVEGNGGTMKSTSGGGGGYDDGHGQHHGQQEVELAATSGTPSASNGITTSSNGTAAITAQHVDLEDVQLSPTTSERVYIPPSAPSTGWVGATGPGDDVVYEQDGYGDQHTVGRVQQHQAPHGGADAPRTHPSTSTSTEPAVIPVTEEQPHTSSYATHVGAGLFTGHTSSSAGAPFSSAGGPSSSGHGMHGRSMSGGPGRTESGASQRLLTTQSGDGSGERETASLTESRSTGTMGFFRTFGVMMWDIVLVARGRRGGGGGIHNTHMYTTYAPCTHPHVYTQMYTHTCIHTHVYTHTHTCAHPHNNHNMPPTGPEKRAFFIALALAVFNQATASTAIINFAPEILASMNVESSNLQTGLAITVTISKVRDDYGVGVVRVGVVYNGVVYNGVVYNGVV